MWSLLFAAVALARPFVAHQGLRTESGVHWTAVVSGADPYTALAHPLEGPVAVAGARAVRDEAGRVVGFEGTSFRFEADESLIDGVVTLHPPLVTGALQRIVVDDARFSPDHVQGLDLKIGRWQTGDVDRRERRRFERVLGRDRGGAVWVGPAGLSAPLVGELAPPGASTASVAGVGAIFAGVVAGLILGVRALEGAVRRERNEVYIRNELGKTPPAR
jgi:hypothetical protein